MVGNQVIFILFVLLTIYLRIVSEMKWMATEIDQRHGYLLVLLTIIHMGYHDPNGLHQNGSHLFQRHRLQIKLFLCVILD